MLNNQSQFNIVLYAPEIPGNTGSIGRTCLALGLRLILIQPYGFDLSEKAVRRAGLDYWKHVDLKEYEDWQQFLLGEGPSREQLFFFSSKGTQNYFKASYSKNSYLIFGPESQGLPTHIFEENFDRMFTMPMYSEHIRSLNLSNAATAVAYEAIRQINFN